MPLISCMTKDFLSCVLVGRYIFFFHVFDSALTVALPALKFLQYAAFTVARRAWRLRFAYQQMSDIERTDAATTIAAKIVHLSVTFTDRAGPDPR